MPNEINDKPIDLYNLSFTRVTWCKRMHSHIYIFVYLFEHTLTKLFQGLHGLEPYSCETLTSSHSKTMVAVKTVVKQHLVIHCDGCHIFSTSVKGKLVKMQ